NMSTHAPLTHSNPKIFPSAQSFDPERWLPGGSARTKYLVPYSKGSRHCLGMHLASAELYMTIAMALRP
ncbi:cytochrome P450, partial [Rhexocercosporidium sp. MPI-PUGE-AT-0058]